MYHTITLTLDNALRHGEQLHVSLAPVQTGISNVFDTEADQAMRLAEVFASLAQLGVKFFVNQDEQRPDQYELDAATDTIEHLRREISMLNDRLLEEKRWNQERAERIVALSNELDEYKLGTMDERMEKAQNYLNAVTHWPNHPHYGQFIEQIKEVRNLTKLGLKEAKDYVEAKSKEQNLGYQR